MIMVDSISVVIATASDGRDMKKKPCSGVNSPQRLLASMTKLPLLRHHEGRYIFFRTIWQRVALPMFLSIPPCPPRASQLWYGAAQPANIRARSNDASPRVNRSHRCLLTKFPDKDTGPWKYKGSTNQIRPPEKDVFECSRCEQK